MKMKLAFIFGTRPEIIKLSPVIRMCMGKNIDFFTVHTGQHYSKKLSKLFIDELKLPEPDHNLHIRSKAPYMQGYQTGKMLIKLEEILLDEMPTVVVIQGDTNSALSGALTASKISTTRSYTGFNIKIAHIEAGLRSYDRNMPEEINRVMADHLSHYLFVPTARAKGTVISEGIARSKIWVTGNTIVDAVNYALGKMKNSKKVPSLEEERYILLTLHRQENVDNKKIFKNIMKGISGIQKETKLPVIFPIHPRTVKKMGKFSISLPGFVKPVSPVGFTDFLELEKNAELVLTDSGGVQEETCILKVPCVTLRTTTERPETVDVGANTVAGVDPAVIIKKARKMFGKRNVWRNPLGSGNAAKKIIDVLLSDHARSLPARSESGVWGGI